MKTVAFVPIKMNSQRLPKKNILKLGGKPLSWYICETLLEVKNIDEVYIYCSDLSIEKFIPDGCNVLQRPSYLDNDIVKGNEIYENFIDSIEADVYVLAHTTSPFLKSSSIQEALFKVQSGVYDSSFSARKEATFVWYDGKPLNYNPKDVPRTQDIKPVYIETSGFYIFNSSVWSNNKKRIGNRPYIKEVDAFEAIDIDTKEDFKFAEKVVNIHDE